jgi:hypothetical protein
MAASSAAVKLMAAGRALQVTYLDQIGIDPPLAAHAAITNALDAGVPLRDAQILARHADPRTTEHYDRARGNLDCHGVHFLTADVTGV